jgi:hypothetical protein
VVTERTALRRVREEEALELSPLMEAGMHDSRRKGRLVHSERCPFLCQQSLDGWLLFAAKVAMCLHFALEHLTTM